MTIFVLLSGDTVERSATDRQLHRQPRLQHWSHSQSQADTAPDAPIVERLRRRALVSHLPM
jgi:hypothetical protein